MPTYEYRCRAHGTFEEHRPFEHSHFDAYCPMCEAVAERVFGNFLFIEDRCRLYRNPRTGTRHSDVLGCDMPEDRTARDALYAEKGIEPVSWTDAPSQWKTAREYAQHLDSGGEKLDRKSEEALIEPPDLSDVKSIKQMMDESGFRLPA